MKGWTEKQTERWTRGKIDKQEDENIIWPRDKRSERKK
jgi:hypothetical protein